MDKDYVYDCETNSTTVYRNKYTGNEIHIPKEKITNGDMIKAIFPNWKIEHIRKMSGVNRYECNIDTINRISFYDDWWNAPYERS